MAGFNKDIKMKDATSEIALFTQQRMDLGCADITMYDF